MLQPFSNIFVNMEHLHDYSKINFEEIEKDIGKMTFDNVEDLKNTLEEN